MPTLDATLAWAIPVDVAKLGHHLQAYINLQPTIIALRLCNRHGKGARASITKLPSELLSPIESCLMQAERDKLRKAWLQDFRCFELLCYPIDHFTPKQLKKLRVRAKAEALAMDDASAVDPNDADAVLDSYLDDEEGFFQWFGTHQDRKEGWEARVGPECFANQGIFGTHADLVRKHFGLEVWVSHIRLMAFSAMNKWTERGNEKPRTTITYLKLPSGQGLSDEWDTSVHEMDELPTYVESGHALRLAVPSELSEKDKAKFERAMNILDVKPHTHSSQMRVQLTSVKPSQSTTAAETKTPPGPQLTMLMKTAVEVSE